MRALLPALFLLMLTACQSVPPTNVHQPMTVRPQLRSEAGAANGAIYHAGVSRPLFEDRRARFVGDTITVKITESTSASANSADKLDRTNAMTAGVSDMSRLPGKSVLGLGLDASSSTAFSGKGEASNKNAFSGSMTATVIEVLPNGNLLISGEKQLSVGHEQEFVRVSGVVNPSYVDAFNNVDSSRIADARIEYKSAGQISDGLNIGWMARFFLNVLPF